MTQLLELAAPTIGAAERRCYADDGHARLDGLWDERFAQRLCNEAQALRSEAAAPESRKPRPPVLAARPEPSREATAASAPLLQQLHLSLVPVARAITGRMMVAAWAVYIYYDTDDAVWLHVDTSECELTLLTTVMGDIGPLHLHPDMWGWSQDDLDRLEATPEWDEHRGVQASYPRLGVLAHRGNHVPHHRPHRPIAQPGAVAALHYSSLF